MPREKKPRRISRKAAKQKGRELQKWTAKWVSRITAIPWGKDKPIQPRGGSQTGVDIMLVGKAREMFPFSVENKWWERWTVLEWIKQAKANQIEGTNWLLICKKNNMEPVVIMDAAAFFRIYRMVLKYKYGADYHRKKGDKK